MAERLVDDGDVADDKRNKAEADTGLKHDESASGLAQRRDIAGAQGEEAGAADVEVGEQVGHDGEARLQRVVEVGAEREKEHAETADEERSPDHEQEQQGEGAKDAVKLVADAPFGKYAGKGDPGTPRDQEEEACDAQAAGGPAGQNDGLKRVQHDAEAEEQAEKEGEEAHACVLWIREVTVRCLEERRR